MFNFPGESIVALCSAHECALLPQTFTHFDSFSGQDLNAFACSNILQDPLSLLSILLWLTGNMYATFCCSSWVCVCLYVCLSVCLPLSLSLSHTRLLNKMLSLGNGEQMIVYSRCECNAIHIPFAKCIYEIPECKHTSLKYFTWKCITYWKYLCNKCSLSI